MLNSTASNQIMKLTVTLITNSIASQIIQCTQNENQPMEETNISEIVKHGNQRNCWKWGSLCSHICVYNVPCYFFNFPKWISFCL